MTTCEEVCEAAVPASEAFACTIDVHARMPVVKNNDNVLFFIISDLLFEVAIYVYVLLR
ncbi:hypothetical protein AltI4_18310 [Alteromonas sp. I4]|nr:hypothetical protein AltI4_18310 [Alteromonas sp. I4]